MYQLILEIVSDIIKYIVRHDIKTNGKNKFRIAHYYIFFFFFVNHLIIVILLSTYINIRVSVIYV